MSMLRYCFRTDDGGEQASYSILPQYCSCSFDYADEDDFDRELGLTSKYFTVDPPRIRVIGYKPKNETICRLPYMEGKPIDEALILSNMLKDPHLTLVNICSRYEFLFAEFRDDRNKDRTVFERSYAFYGKINIEVTYENRSPKLYKFRSSENWIEIIETDETSFRDIMIDHGTDGTSFVDIQEWHQ